MTPHQILERLGGERFLQRFIREVEAVANATEETGQNGKVTLTVKTFKPKEAEKGDQYIGLETRIVPTWPAPKARRTGLYVDDDGLNNRRSNLRLATRPQNGQNNHAVSGAVPYRGVFVDKRQPGHWRAAIKHLGKRTYLGSFDTPEDAARAYDSAAVTMHGRFASTNFPLPQPMGASPELMYKLASGICLTVDELLQSLAAVGRP